MVKGKFGIAPLPGLTADKPGASSLGGHSWAMSVYGKHKATALDFMKFSESDAVQSFLLTQASLAPTLASLYTNTALVAKFPYLPVLLQSIQSAVPRPVTPFYPAVTKAIETNVYAALQGQKSTRTGLKGPPGGNHLSLQRRRLILAYRLGGARSLECAPPRRLQSDPLGRR